MDDLKQLLGFAKHDNPRVLTELLSDGSTTTDIVDEFLENDYKFLVLCGYNVSRGRNRTYHNTFWETTEEEDDVFNVEFYLSKSPIIKSWGPMATYSMTDMKEMSGITFRKDLDSDELDLSTIMLKTLDKHQDEIYDEEPHLLELEGLFGIRAQSSDDRYSYGYGEHHTLYITHIEVRASHGEYYWYDE